MTHEQKILIFDGSTHSINQFIAEFKTECKFITRKELTRTLEIAGFTIKTGEYVIIENGAARVMTAHDFHEQKIHYSIIKNFINKVLHLGNENATYEALVNELWALPKEAGGAKIDDTGIDFVSLKDWAKIAVNRKREQLSNDEYSLNRYSDELYKTSAGDRVFLYNFLKENKQFIKDMPFEL